MGFGSILGVNLHLRQIQREAEFIAALERHGDALIGADRWGRVYYHGRTHIPAVSRAPRAE